MRSRTDTPTSSSSLAAIKPAAERLETTGDLQLGCVFCHHPASETVIFWPVGRHFLVAHVECAQRQVAS